MTAPTVSLRPVVIPADAHRGADLEVRVTVPVGGRDLPTVVFSHGFGFSMDAYGPLVDAWAAGGIAVVQPTHLDSIALGLAPDDPRTPEVWRHRIADLGLVLDRLEQIEREVSDHDGLLDHGRIAVAGHSYGATTASALLGARVVDTPAHADEDWTDARVSAGVLLALAGTGGDDLTPFAAEAFPFMSPRFDAMRAPALLVGGDADQSLLSTRGPDWWTDGYRLSPPGKSLLTVFGAEHSLGGIEAYAGMPHTPAESPEMVALVARSTTAYLRTALGLDDGSWPAARAELTQPASPVGRLESR